MVVWLLWWCIYFGGCNCGGVVVVAVWLLWWCDFSGLVVLVVWLLYCWGVVAVVFVMWLLWLLRHGL